MESNLSWLHPFWAFGLPIALSFPLGWLMCRSLDVPADRAGRGLDALPMLLCRLLGRREPARMDWKRYAVAMLAFNAALFVLTFGLLYAQHASCLLNPDGKGSLAALGYKDAAGVQHHGADTGVVFNTVCSFVTNTNLQHYSGEQHLSYFSQLAAIVWLHVRHAGGRPVRDAGGHPRPAGRQGPGHFYVDLMRGLVFVLVPLLPGRRAAPGGHRRADDLPGGGAGDDARRRGDEMETQTIARGPVAALVAIKQLGHQRRRLLRARTRPTRSRTRRPGATCSSSSRSSSCRWPRRHVRADAAQPCGTRR